MVHQCMCVILMASLNDYLLARYHIARSSVLGMLVTLEILHDITCIADHNFVLLLFKNTPL